MHAKKLAVWAGIVVVLIIIALGFSIVAKKVEAPTVTTLPASPILGGVATTSDMYEYAEDKPYYMVDVQYPAKTSLAAGANAKATRVMEQALADDIAQFKTDGDFANLTAADAQIQGLGDDRKYAFGATYQSYQSAGTVSYVFTIYEDTLGAHPNGFYQTFTFDMQGNQLQLADLFKPGANYLDRLSPLAYAGVLAQLRQRTEVDPESPELDTVRIGTSPTPESLQFFYVDGNTLHLLFPPYQVAAYAAGSFDVAIPLGQLTDILK
jgi:hypothetical protein